MERSGLCSSSSEAVSEVPASLIFKAESCIGEDLEKDFRMGRTDHTKQRVWQKCSQCLQLRYLHHPANKSLLPSKALGAERHKIPMMRLCCSRCSMGCSGMLEDAWSTVLMARAVLWCWRGLSRAQLRMQNVPASPPRSAVPPTEGFNLTGGNLWLMSELALSKRAGGKGRENK